MSDADRAPLDPFPDVRVRPQIALLLITGLSVVFATVFVGLASPARTQGIALYASFGLGASLLVLSYIDLRTGLLLDVITLPLIVSGIAFAWFSDGSWLFAVAGAALGYVLIAGLGYVWRQMRGYEGIGLGDAKLLAAGGAWVGIAMLPVILLVASGAGLIGAVFVALKPQNNEDRVAIPFGPALAFGIWTAWCADGLVFP